MTRYATWCAGAALLFAMTTIAHAGADELLVRSAPTTSGKDWSWQRPFDAVAVQVLRGTASPMPFVMLAEVGESESVLVCLNDPAVVVGSQSSCKRLESGSNWMRKSDAFSAASPPTDPAPVEEPTHPDDLPPGTPGYVRININAGPRPTTWTDGAPIPAGTDIWLRLYENSQLIESVPWAARLSVTRTYVAPFPNVCFRAEGFVDLDGDGVSGSHTDDSGLTTFEESYSGDGECTKPKPRTERRPAVELSISFEDLAPGESLPGSPSQ